MAYHKKPKIFLSYAWANLSIADEIDADFKEFGINLTRDVRFLPFRKSIKEFMESIDKHKFVLMLVTDEYLRSENCMYEATELLGTHEFRERVLPIVHDNARGIFRPMGSSVYIDYWTVKLLEAKEFNKKNANQVSVDGLRKINSIHNSIDVFFAQLSDLNTISIASLKQENYLPIFEIIRLEKQNSSSKTGRIRENNNVTPLKTNDYLELGDEIKIGDRLVSLNGKYSLIMQEDGNLVIYHLDGAAIWSTKTHNMNVAKCIFQHDGNFVLYNSNGIPVWPSDTQGKGCNRLTIADDGSLIIYAKEQKIYQSRKAEPEYSNLSRLPQCVFKITNKRYDTCLDCWDAGHDEAWSIQHYAHFHGEKHQRRGFKQHANKNIVIFSPACGRCLDTYDQDGDSKVHLYPFHGGENQQWKIELQEDYSFKIFSIKNGKCLDAWIEGGKNILHLHESHDDPCQRWWLNQLFT